MKARLYLDYDPDLSPKSRLSIRRNPKKEDGSVFSRLYDDAVKQQRYGSASPQFGARPSIFRRSSEHQLNHIRTLMAKHVKSMEKIEKEREKLEFEQLKEIRDKPAINQESRQIADKALDKNLEAHARAEYAASRHNKTKSENIKIEVFKDKRPVSPDLMSAAQVTSSMVHAFTTRNSSMATTPVCKVNITTGVGSNIELPKNEAVEEMFSKVASLKNIRSLLAQSYNFDPIEPPDPLEMNFMDRGKYWTEQRLKKLQEKAEVAKGTELMGCTFSPKISPPKHFSQLRYSASVSTTPKYAEIHNSRPSFRLSFKKDLESTCKSEQVERAVTPSAAGTVEGLKPKAVVYSSLSPVTLECSFKSSSIFNRLKRKNAPQTSKRGVNLRLK
mmetsp:Transcript_34105/g.59480  ORF Transcript_34105/g.59480 Transcript_34105/m.59480 type:complete len:387 (-) Transcript_34105:535-1695(-)